MKPNTLAPSFRRRPESNNETTSRSGQNPDVVPLTREVINHLDTGLRWYDAFFSNGLFGLNKDSSHALGMAERGAPATRPLSPAPCPLSSERGFTLVEMVMVIVITGIIGGMVAVFLKIPVDQYLDVARRAEITDTADTALRRIGRDLRLALPNSVRRAGACGGGDTCFLEFLPAPSGGRYRADIDATDDVCPGGNTDDDILTFTTADSCFEVLGNLPAPLAAGDQIVVYNLGIAGADAYAGDNTAAYSSTSGTSIIITAKLFPFDSPSHRFHVISTPVTYACDPAAGTLTRWQGYAIQAGQPVALPGGGTSAVLANNVSNCLFTYDPLVVGRNGLVTMNLGITRSGETVTLYSATHVSNVP